MIDYKHDVCVYQSNVAGACFARSPVLMSLSGHTLDTSTFLIQFILVGIPPISIVALAGQATGTIKDYYYC